MSYINLIDTHTHTDNSFDGHVPAKELVAEAINKGIKVMAITDHLELDVFYEKDFDKTAENSFNDITEARDFYAGKIELLRGAEFGEAVYERELSEEIINKYDYDMVIGAIHNLPHKDDFYDMDLSEIDFYPLLDEYFELELEMAKWAKFDTLAHLTYPLRYIIGKYHREADMSRYASIIDETLKALIKNGKALELNTAGYRQPIGIPSPDGGIITRYRELGGKLLTIGSDAHYSEHLATDVDRGLKLAVDCGFDEITYFRKREPVFLTIE